MSHDLLQGGKITYKHLVPTQLKYPVAFVRSGKSDENDQREGIKRFATRRDLEIIRWENDDSPDSPHITGHKRFKNLLMRMDRDGEYMILIEAWKQISAYEKVRAELLERALRYGIIVTCADGKSTYSAYKRRMTSILLEDLAQPEAKISQRALHAEYAGSKDLPLGYEITDLGKLTKDQRKELFFLRVKQLRSEHKTLKQIHAILLSEGHTSTTGKPLTPGLLALVASKVAPVGRGHNSNVTTRKKRRSA